MYREPNTQKISPQNYEDFAGYQNFLGFFFTKRNKTEVKGTNVPESSDFCSYETPFMPASSTRPSLSPHAAVSGKS